MLLKNMAVPLWNKMLESLNNKISRKIWTQCWCIGFVEGGIPSILQHDTYNVKWVRMPRNRWFADPFVLDVLDTEIILLVEDYAYATQKGVISLLHIDSKTMRIRKRKVLLELATHVSFPIIFRRENHVYIYPESAQKGSLDVYEYNSKTESVVFCKTICNDVIWDSVFTNIFGVPYLFTSNKDDYHLDIYKWDEQTHKFIAYLCYENSKPNCRMGGEIFEYNGRVYYPAQDCEKTYGGAIDIKEIQYDKENQSFIFKEKRHIVSPHKRMKLGIHTLNEYKGTVVIDAKGYRYGNIIALIELQHKLRQYIKRLLWKA